MIDGVNVTAGAAMQFGAMVETVVDRGLAGLEFGEGIPGTVGGGLVMNAGAFGGEMARVVTLVHGVTAEGAARALTKDEVNFAYRRTDLPPRFVITRVDFQLASWRSRRVAGAGDGSPFQARCASTARTAQCGIGVQKSAGKFRRAIARKRRSQGDAHGWRGVLRTACEFYREPGRRAGR